MANGLTNVHVDIGADKVSDKTRVDRAGIVAAMATKTALYNGDPGFKDSVDALAQAGVDLATSDSEISQLEAELTKARGAHDTKLNAFDRVYGVCVASVERHSTRPEDVQGYGFAVLAKSAKGLVAPTEIQARFDPVKEVIRVRVLYASGKHQCAIEVSPDPMSPTSWKRVEGSGVSQALAGHAPGTWWVRAATLRAKERSDWVGPVAVLVK